MKRLLFSLALILLIFSFAKAQQPFSLSWDGNIIGDTVTVWCDPATYETVFHANVTNNAGDAKNIKVARYEISIVSGTLNFLHWVQNNSPISDTSFSYQLVKAGESAEGANAFAGHFQPANKIGISSIKYTFYNVALPSEQVSVVVNFWASPASIAEDAMQGGSISEIYPNPATNYVNLDFDLTPSVKEAKVRVINLLGSVVKDVEIERGTNQLRLDISDLDNGVYFYTVLINGDAYKTKKLIVR